MDDDIERRCALYELTIEELEAKIAKLEFQLKIQRKNQIYKLTLIQKRWKSIYQNKVNCANIIKNTIRKAIANPYTQLCQNRLLHEFNNM